MTLKKTKNQIVSFSKALLAFSLTEALLAAVLVGIVSALAVSALNVSGQIQGIQSNKIVQAAMMEIQGSITKYKQRNGPMDLSTIRMTPYSNIDGNVVTGISIDGMTPADTISCSSPNQVCRRLKSGAIVSYWNSNTITWGTGAFYNPRGIPVDGIYIDPDGVDSSPTNDAGQSVTLLFTMQGTFLTSTPWQWSQVSTSQGQPAGVFTVQQPRYFRMDK
jgi:type II secretory pathway pseudopilin PulG